MMDFTCFTLKGGKVVQYRGDREIEKKETLGPCPTGYPYPWRDTYCTTDSSLPTVTQLPCSRLQVLP